ncbi:MAG: methyltransferase domain-containing protein [Actinomycetia bacterium]|nr:methyltransferase domain-containing protein [Actinomycetes bacterium]
MAMNFCHRLCCSSNYWAKTVARDLLPWALNDVELGDRTLEIGPGYGASLRVLVEKSPSLTSLEVDGPMAARLQRRYGDRARVINGDGTATGLPDADFSSVVCFTMLHHIPTPPLQDDLFAEAFRVLTPGGVFAGSDGMHSLPFRLVHLGDTYNPVSPDTLPERLRQAGFSEIHVDTKGRDQRWRALKPV